MNFIFHPTHKHQHDGRTWLESSAQAIRVLLLPAPPLPCEVSGRSQPQVPYKPTISPPRARTRQAWRASAGIYASHLFEGARAPLAIRVPHLKRLFSDILNETPGSLYTREAERNFALAQEDRKPHRLHVFAHKHNTHITLVQPPRSAAETATSRVIGARTTSTEQKKIVDVLLSLSTGNIGFRKAGRGSYDAAFQLAAFTLKQIQEKGMWRDITKLEVFLRGFGAG